MSDHIYGLLEANTK